MIRFACPACGQRLRSEPDLAGGKAICPRCRLTVYVPDPPEQAPPALTQPVPTPFYDDEDDEASGFSKPVEKIDPEELIDMTAMVDIVFFLLIFFLVTSFAAIYSSAPLPTPESDEAGAASLAMDDEEAEGDWITVRIDSRNAVEIDDVPIDDLSDVEFRLNEIRRAGRGADGLLILAHGDATHGTAVTILDAAYDAGMEKLKMKVSDEETE